MAYKDGVSQESQKPPSPPTPDASKQPRCEAPVINNNTGRVKHDDRGNAIWEWAVSTGAMVVETSTQRMKKLDNPTLSLIDDSRPDGGPVKENPRGTVQGYSPYDSGLLGRKEAPRKKDLRRLSEWLKLKKQAESRKPDDE